MNAPTVSLITRSDNVQPAYAALAKIAARELHREPFAYLWSPASLINETWIRLASVYDRAWLESSCPLPLWRRAMRNVLIDHARSQRADKRRWGTEVPDAYSSVPSREPHPDNLLHVAKALETARQLNSRSRIVVDLVFVEGVSIGRAAAILKVTPRTVNRTIRAVRETLREELS